MRLTVIGCSPAWPNPGGAHSGYLVEETGRLLLDCGPGVLPRLRGQGGWPAVDAIAITHLHLDHWGDLVPWAWGLLYGPGSGTSRPSLHLPPGGRQALAGIGDLLGSAHVFDQAFEIAEYAHGEPFEAAGLSLTALRVPHYVADAYGFRAESGSALLAYSGDTAPGEEVVAVGRDADLFLCEATLEAPETGRRGHLTLAEAAAASEAAGARRLLVVHRSVELDSAPYEAAREGLVVEV